MNKIFSILIGLILVVLSVYSVGLNLFGLKQAALIVFKGILVWIVFFAGLALLALGINDLKN